MLRCQPRQRFPRRLHLRLQLGIGVLPKIDEVAVVAAGFVAVAEGLVELAEAAEDDWMPTEIVLVPQGGTCKRR